MISCKQVARRVENSFKSMQECSHGPFSMFKGTAIIFSLHAPHPSIVYNTNIRGCDKDEKKAVTRLLNIWRERRVFPADYIENISKSLLGMAPSEQVQPSPLCHFSSVFLLVSFLFILATSDSFIFIIVNIKCPCGT